MGRSALRVRLAVVFGVSIAALLLAVTLLLVLSARLNQSRSERDAWSQGARAVADLDAQWEAQQAALRGLELTGSEVFSAEYQGADARAGQLEQVLRELVASREALRRDIGDAVEATVAGRRRWKEETVAVRLGILSSGQQVPADLVVAGQAALEEARRPLRALRTSAEAGLNEVRSTVRDRSTAFVTAGAGVAAVALAALVAFVLVLQRWVTRPMAEVGRAVGRLAEGELDQPVPVRGPAEIATLAADVDRMRLRLREEMARVVDSSYVAAAEDERARLAGEIHDDTLQTMAAVSIRLELLARKVDDDEVQEQLNRCREGISDASRRLRTLLFELHPPSLDSAGLAAALEDYADFVLGGTGTEVAVQGSLAAEPPRAVQALGYRVGRELVLNAAKHAKASTLAITVRDRDSGVEVIVEDDGVGLPPPGSDGTGGRGLRGLRELVERAGGRSTVGAAPGGGARVAVWLPT